MNKKLLTVLIILVSIVALSLTYLAGFRTSKAITGKLIIMPSPCPYCGDLNEDGKVGFWDISRITANFGKCNKTAYQGDLNGDNCVNTADITLFSGNYGKKCSDILTGAIDVSSSIPTSVFLDGIHQGQTSGLLRIREVIPGEHILTFVKKDYKNNIQNITVNSGCSISFVYADMQR